MNETTSTARTQHLWEQQHYFPFSTGSTSTHTPYPIHSSDNLNKMARDNGSRGLYRHSSASANELKVTTPTPRATVLCNDLD